MIRRVGFMLLWLLVAAIAPAWAADDYALVIGISTYPRLASNAQLLYAEKDAQSFASFISRPTGGEFDPTRITLLKGSAATRAAILRNVDALSRLNHIERLYVFFAGHSEQDRSGRTFLIPYDGVPDAPLETQIPLDVFLQSIIGGVNASAVVFFIDACHAAAPVAQDTRLDARESVISGTWPQVLSGADGQVRLAFFASAANQRSWEDAALGHGLFTHALLQGLDGAADKDGNGLVVAHELQTYLSEQVSGLAKRTFRVTQTPVLSATSGLEFPLGGKNLSARRAADRRRSPIVTIEGTDDEARAWSALDTTDVDELAWFIETYPNTNHRRDDLNGLAGRAAPLDQLFHPQISVDFGLRAALLPDRRAIEDKLYPVWKVTHVVIGGPAERSGIRVGDLMVSMNKEPLRDWFALDRWRIRLKPGDSASIQLVRDAEVITATLRVEEPRAVDSRGCNSGDQDSCFQLNMVSGPKPGSSQLSTNTLAQSCERGIAAACMALPQHSTTTLATLDLACSSGSGRACALLAQRMLKGELAGKTASEGLDLARRACFELLDPRGCAVAAEGTPQRDERTRQRLARLACDGGDDIGCQQLADIYEKKDLPFPFSPPRAIYARSLHEKSCVAGGADSCAKAADMRHRATDDALAALLAERACDRGSARGCALYGQYLRDGVGIVPDRQKSNASFRKACDGNDLDGCNEVGRVLERQGSYSLAKDAYLKSCRLSANRVGCNEARKLALTSREPGWADVVVELYERICFHQKQDSSDISFLSYLSTCGSRSFFDGRREVSAALLSKCNTNDPVACIMIAREDVKRDQTRSLQLFERSCLAGVAEGCTGGARVYEARGEHQAAFANIRRACEFKDADACLIVAGAYETGQHGLERSLADARRFYAKACDFGNSHACDRAREK